jgi:predicted ATP-dependent serine protease
MNLNIERTNFVRACDVAIPSTFFNRLTTGVKEIDEMFGEGIIPGSSFTVTGRAGSGKSSFLLQLMEGLANNGYNVGYASGEENQHQLAYTCKRLNVSNVSIANETDIDNLVNATKDFDALVVDSFQALTSSNKLNSAELERYAISSLVKAAKENECALFIVMHFTKNGSLKGSTLVPHTVDVNVQIELEDEDGDPTARVISFIKNRFGATLDYRASMNSKGFTFSGKVVEQEVTPSKNARKKFLTDSILKLDPPLITKSTIMTSFNLSGSQAYLILKELCDTNKLVKIGRGDNACFKKVLVEEKVVS